VNDFADAVPGYVEDLTAGRGRLGFLERDYHIVERVREALSEGGASQVLGISGTALSVTKSVLTAVVATLTIAFLTVFMLLEGPNWMERFYSLLPPEKQPRWGSSRPRCCSPWTSPTRWRSVSSWPSST
jgi:predicted PurR-regulated permease PerM